MATSPNYQNPAPVPTLIYDSGIEPVTVTEAASFLRIDLSNVYSQSVEETALLASLIKVARHAAEHMTGRAFTDQTWALYMDGFPLDPNGIRLCKPPVRQTHILYQDVDGTTQLMDPKWTYLTYDLVPYIRLLPTRTWPATEVTPGAVQVSFRCGMYRESTGDSPGELNLVPPPVRHWILMKVGELYENRERSNPDTVSVKDFVDHLLDPWIIQECSYVGW